ncbi:MAG: hypothetical protein QF645_05465 [Planctomycetota bacterium]|nr:hypothetical protein [Planctomycetota bacterium]
MKGVVEAVEIVEDTDHRAEFNNLAVIEMAFHRGKALIRNICRIGRHLTGKPDRSRRSIIKAIELSVLRRLNLFVGSTSRTGQLSVGGKSVVTLFDRRNAKSEILF